jgi:hypothetical protein
MGHWDDRQRRLRCPRQHGDHLLLHPLPFHVRFDDPAAAGARRPRGYPGAGRHAGLAGLGFATTVISIVLALIPAEDELHKVLAVTKVAGLTVLLVAAGALVYWRGRWRRA